MCSENISAINIIGFSSSEIFIINNNTTAISLLWNEALPPSVPLCQRNRRWLLTTASDGRT